MKARLVLVLCLACVLAVASVADAGTVKPKVYVTYCSNPSTWSNSIAAALSSRFDVTLGVKTAPAVVASDLTGYDAVFVVGAQDGDCYLASALENVYKPFVNSGGGLITSGWVAYYNNHDILPMWANYDYLSNGGTIVGVTITKSTADPIINMGMPDSFTVDEDWRGGSEGRLAPKAGATVFYTETQGGWWNNNALIGWDYGANGGRVASLASVLGPNPLSSADYVQMMNNAVEWAINAPPPTNPVPEPMTMAAVGMGIAGLGGYLRRRTAAK